MNRHQGPLESDGTKLPEALADNIRMLLEQHHKDLQCNSRAEAIVRAIATFTGSVAFITLHLLLYGIWFALSKGIGSVTPVDPHLSGMAVFASLESLFLSACILFNQDRNTRVADERAQLHLNISLIAERESTRIIRLVAAIAERMGIQQSEDLDLKELMEDIQPSDVLEEIKKSSASVK